MTEMIPSSEVSFHPHSFGDQQIRLFQWKGQLYRALSAEYADFFKPLFRNQTIDDLVRSGLLIDAETTSLALDGYEMVVHHRKIAFASYPNEWCAAMFKDGALTLIELAIELARRGYTLGDAHPWNLVYDIDHHKTIFVDLGSITRLTDFTWSLYDEFCRFCLYPLMMMAQGEDRLARLLMCEDEGIAPFDMRRLKGLSPAFLLTQSRYWLIRSERGYVRRVPEFYREWLRKAAGLGEENMRRPGSETFNRPSHPVRAKIHRYFLEGVRRDVERIKIPSTTVQEENILVAATPQPHCTPAQYVWYKLLADLKPRSLLDIGSESAWHAKVAALQQIPVVRWDAEPAKVARFYNDAKEGKLPLLPLVMDFLKPTPGRGWANHRSIPAVDRFQCEMVVALGVLHRIVAERRLNFDQILDGLLSLATRWVVVEFRTREQPEAGTQPIPLSWYTLDNFLRAAIRRCRQVRTVLQEGNKHLLLCEKY